MKHSLEKVHHFITGKPTITCTETGWCYNYYKSESTRDFEAEAKRAIKRHENGSLDFTPGIESMQKIIALCHQKNLQIILISFPVTSEYVKQSNLLKFEKTSGPVKTFANYTTILNITIIHMIKELQMKTFMIPIT